MDKLMYVGLLILFCTGLYSQADYSNLNQIELRLNDMAKSNPSIATLQSIAKSPGGNSIWMLKIGLGQSDFRPGIAMVAGVDGTHPAGTELVLKMAARLLEKERSYFEDKVFYLFPCVNPDAYRQYFGPLRYERHGNARPTDDDRDGYLDEDPFEDLNNDGFITWVRIEDPTGDKMAHKDDPRILIPVKEREAGMNLFKVISEGIDNDKDGSFNEDGPGGVHINKNFSFDYPAFKDGAGEHAVSEPENRALADFLFDHWNIYAVFTFGPENNLNEPVKHDPKKVAKRVITGPYEADGKVNEMVSEWYKKIPGTKDAIPMSQGPGSFSSWAYFHYGRYSYVTPGWWAPKLEAPKDTTQTEVKKEGPPGRGNAKEEPYDLRYVKWADSMGVQNYFVDWQSINHPDFPGQKAEVGGFKPFVRFNPPLQYLKEVADNHFTFIETYAEKLPKLQFQGVRTEKLDDNTFRITGRLVNTGLLPTHTALGDRTRWVRKIRNRIELDKNQTLLLGVNHTFHDAIQPGESFEFSWLVNGKGKITLEAGSPMTGLQSLSLDLK
jgi:hypothetical protein